MSENIHPAVTIYEGRKAHDYAYFDRVPFEVVHANLIRFLPSEPFAALDVGAGSGRDALALVKRGATVDAVEPWTEMRNLAKSATRDVPEIRWIDDQLPDLQVISALEKQYDLIVLSAVLMHLGPNERAIALGVLRAMLSERGHIYLSIRNPPDASRHMFAVDANNLVDTAWRNGLTCTLSVLGEADALGRDGITWDFFAFKSILSAIPYSSE